MADTKVLFGRKTLLSVTSAIAALMAPQIAAAQDNAQPAANDAAAEEIIITGSRVRGTAPIGSAITTLDTKDIAESGRVTIDRAIKELPQVFDLGVSENSRGQSGGSGNIVYGNSINLRGIGPSATLILVDGHRVTNNGRSTDPSVLPSLGVQRVEVVADGASAIYGSDAVAGVVNLIPRRNLNGIEAFARGGLTDGNDYHEISAGVAAGKVWDGGQIMIAYEHVDKANLNGDDRDYFRSDQTAFGGKDYRVTRCSPGTITAAGVTYAIPAGGISQAGAAGLTAGTSNKCDDLQQQDLIPQQKYDSVNGTVSLDVTDWLTVFADGFYSRRDFYRRSAQSSATLTVPQTNAFFVRPTGFAGTSYTIGYNFSGDVASNDTWGYGQSWQITPGVRAKLPGGWEFEALFGYGKTRDNSFSTKGVNNTALNAALASSDPALAFDPYSLHRTNKSVLDGIFNQIFFAPTNGNFKGYEARLNGSVITLPGGEVKAALGYEGQEFDIALGSAIGGPTTAMAWRYFGRRIDSGYAQLVIPIFGSENAMPGFQKLVLDAAVRYDKYSDVGDTTNPKFGVNWTPIDTLTLRGSYGTSFRAPSFPEIYGNSNRLFVQSYQNPTGGAPIVGVAVSGANLNLKPETATTWSVGADWDAAPRLRFSVTYFSVDYKNKIIALLSDLAVLTRASLYNGTGIILQGTDAAAKVQEFVNQGLSIAGVLPNPVTLFVDGRNNNLGSSVTRGIDFSMNYRMPTTSAGTFGFNINGTYVTDYKTQQTPTAPAVSQLNQIFQPLRFKARATLNWQKGPLSALLRVTHVGGYTNTAITPNEAVSSYTPVDLNVSWRINPSSTVKSIVLGAELRNAFDAKPPYVNIAPSGNGSGGYDATAADPVGRFFAISARMSL
ncbi:MAG: TonB-dependent receptor [Sphingobium sp.]|nr:TonB-dependent receptor [Sphingobium sp.]